MCFIIITVLFYNTLWALCSFASGCMALPVLMNIKQVIEQRQCSGVWTHKDELPVSPFEFAPNATFYSFTTIWLIHVMLVLAD